ISRHILQSLKKKPFRILSLLPNNSRSLRIMNSLVKRNRQIREALSISIIRQLWQEEKKISEEDGEHVLWKTTGGFRPRLQDLTLTAQKKKKEEQRRLLKTICTNRKFISQEFQKRKRKSTV